MMSQTMNVMMMMSLIMNWGMSLLVMTMMTTVMTMMMSLMMNQIMSLALMVMTMTVMVWTNLMINSTVNLVMNMMMNLMVMMSLMMNVMASLVAMIMIMGMRMAATTAPRDCGRVIIWAAKGAYGNKCLRRRSQPPTKQFVETLGQVWARVERSQLIALLCVVETRSAFASVLRAPAMGARVVRHTFKKCARPPPGAVPSNSRAGRIASLSAR